MLLLWISNLSEHVMQETLKKGNAICEFMVKSGMEKQK